MGRTPATDTVDLFDTGISAEDYELWVRPSLAMEPLLAHLGLVASQDEILGRLGGGELIAVAKNSNWFSRTGVTAESYRSLGAFLWLINSRPNVDALLWKTGTHTLSRPLPGSQERFAVQCFGIRFEPAGVNAMMADAGLEAAMAITVQETSPPAAAIFPQLAKTEAERFCRAIVAGWPDATQDFAHEKASLFYPSNRIPRDWFRGIFRSIRGDTKPGIKPKTGN